jgi:sulfur-oxidizing protein SoxZ
MANTRIRTKSAEGGAIEILALAQHPMETGQRPDPNDKTKKIPAHWIQKMTVSLNGKEIATADMGVAVSKNPVIGVRVKGAKPGDKVKISWTDNKGESDSAETDVTA